MNNRFITLTLLCIILFIFTFYFIVQRTIFPSGQPISGFFQGIIEDVKENAWTEAQKKADRLEETWEKHKFLIMLNYSEADYQILEDTIYRLVAAVETEKEYEVIGRAKAGQKLWINFLKIIPEP